MNTIFRENFKYPTTMYLLQKCTITSILMPIIIVPTKQYDRQKNG